MMMLLQGWSFSMHSRVVVSNSERYGEMRKHVFRPHLSGSGSSGEIQLGQCHHHFLRSNAGPTLSSTRTLSSSCFSTLCASNVEIVDIVHNKVLIAAAVSAALGQLSKPFTSAILHGNKFDLKSAFQAGGFPSTHSSAVVATATILGLERGFSDAIFGLAVIYAGIVMYDAQGVRREVGSQAKVLNRVLFRNNVESFSSCDVNDSTEYFPEEVSTNIETFDASSLRKFRSSQLRVPNAPLLLKSENRTWRMPIVKGDSESIPFGCTPLKESVGHTEIEVIAGALLGFFVSIAVNRI
ncbi:uncharacterized protein LOC113770640 [Coffea eugenioides]|uniref:uncharacterized protein LOC113770640 n=1 Tax=Coffea eugenioides TaxID=49369 RepID=UPI000F606E54|nr:uncharacterized protein LOC113770640 [Coffea eugenioides]